MEGLASGSVPTLEAEAPGHRGRGRTVAVAEVVAEVVVAAFSLQPGWIWAAWPGPRCPWGGAGSRLSHSVLSL